MTATIVAVTKLEPMIGYDTIELASVLGWQVVVKRGEFAVGDLGCYYSIGSVLPKEGPTEFLAGKPLKTKRFKDYISQGLLLPLGVVDITDGVDGQDVTERLGVKKFIPAEEAELYKETANKGPWCPLVPKTDEERIQNCLPKLVKHMGEDIVITRKMDGTSFTFVWLRTSNGDGKSMVCNRNHHLLTIDSNSRVYFTMAKKHDLAVKLTKLGRNLAIQAEILGPKINGNRHGLSDYSMFVFNIYDIDAGCYLNWDEVVTICTELDLLVAPVVYRGPLTQELCSVDTLLKLATTEMENGLPYEGIVLKTVSSIPRFSCKCISNEYILRYKL